MQLNSKVRSLMVGRNMARRIERRLSPSIAPVRLSDSGLCSVLQPRTSSWWRCRPGLLWLDLFVLVVAGQASSLKPDETVVFFPTVGWLHPERAKWEVEVHGWVVEREDRTVSLSALRTALELGGLEWDETAQGLFAERACWFLADNERGKRVTVALEGREFSMPKSDANGHFTTRIEMPADPAESTQGTGRGTRVIAVQGAGGTRGKRAIAGAVYLLSPTGLSVISDIDDTIKVSEVGDREALLRNTFLRPYHPVPGMAEVYAGWATDSGASFHYVTASPWQLYPDLTVFIRSNGFPEGTFHMKLFRWKDRSFRELFQSPERYKLKVIQPLLKRFPGRHFVLVGDSGERDPEIYGELARRHPKQVRRILIRDVTGEGKEAERYCRAFAGLSNGLTAVFSEPREIRNTRGAPPSR